MTDRFVDQYSPPCMPGYPCISSPRWATLITRVTSGSEQTAQLWEHPMYRFTLPEAVREHQVFEAVRDMWLAMRGPAHTWPFRDPLDFASKPLRVPNEAPQVSMLDQQIGVGDGAKTRFRITKTYTYGPKQYVRRIHLPVVSSVIVSVNGVLVTSGYTITRPGGEVVFDTPPPAGHIVRVGFLFDVEVRFESDDTFDGIVRTWQVSGFADITLVETRPC